MRQINTYEKSRMMELAESSFSDLCSIHVPTITQDSFGDQTRSFTTTDDVPCGYNPTNIVTTYRGQTVTLDADAILRLPLTQSLDDKSEITVRNIRYSIDGIISGSTVKVVKLRRVAVDE